MFITSYIWPISARHDMRVGLSELYLHLGWFFRTTKVRSKADKIKLSNGITGQAAERDDEIEHSPISYIRPFMNVEQELALQGLLIHLRGLLKAAASEPRLKVVTSSSLISGPISSGVISYSLVEPTGRPRYVIPLSGNTRRRSSISKRHRHPPPPNRHECKRNL